jgi:Recombinase
MKQRINIFKVTKAAMAAAKAHDVNQAKADSRAADLRPVIEEIRASGCMSLRQIAAALNDRGIVTARGSEWKAMQVRLLLQRLDQPTTTAESLKNRGIGSRKGNVTNKANADERAADLLPVIEDIRASGATSLHQIADALNERGFVTPRGKEWHAVQVRNLLARLGNLPPVA